MGSYAGWSGSSESWIRSANTRLTKRRIAGRERKFWVRCSTAPPAARAASAEAAEEGDLGAAEAVDRLLGVAHHHEPTGPFPREEARHLDLQRVGVLELVDDQEAEALRK